MKICETSASPTAVATGAHTHMPTPPNGDAARAAAGATSKAAAVARQQEAELAVEQRRKAIVASFEAQRRALEAERATRAADVSVAAESPVPVPAAATQTHCWRERLFVPVTPPSLPLPPPPPPRSGAAFSVEKAIAALKTVDDAAACVTLLEGLRSAVSPYGGFGPRQGTSLRERVARNGGVPVVVSALAAHAADRRVVRAASQTLAVLVEGRSADADAACAAGAPAMLVMAALSTREGASGDDETTAAWCAAALQVRLQIGALPEPKDASLQRSPLIARRPSLPPRSAAASLSATPVRQSWPFAYPRAMLPRRHLRLWHFWRRCAARKRCLAGRHRTGPPAP